MKKGLSNPAITLDYQMFHGAELNADEIQFHSEIILLISNIGSLFQLFNGLLIYSLQLQLNKQKNLLHQDETLITSGYYKQYMFDSILVLI